MLMAPVSMAVAIPKERENSTRPTASSMATTINKSLVIGPCALYCFTTISVAAGAVAAAIAPRVMAEDIDIREGNRKWRERRAMSTTIVVITAWRIPTVIALRPMVFRSLSLNSLPISKAMKPRAAWEMIENEFTSSIVEKPIPLMPALPSTNGPIRSPATR